MKYLYRAANVWWRCAQYLVISACARYLETIDVCIWRMFIFMSVLVTVWGFVGRFCVAAVVEDGVLASEC